MDYYKPICFLLHPYLLCSGEGHKILQGCSSEELYKDWRCTPNMQRLSLQRIPGVWRTWMWWPGHWL